MAWRFRPSSFDIDEWTTLGGEGKLVSCAVSGTIHGRRADGVLIRADATIILSPAELDELDALIQRAAERAMREVGDLLSQADAI